MNAPSLDGFRVRAAEDLESLAPTLRARGGRIWVGIELRQVTRGASGGIVVVLVGTLQELFKRRQDIDFVVFCTVFNRELLAVDAPNVQAITLSLHNFFPELARIAREDEIDVLLRSYPTLEEVDFTLGRQIFFLPDVHTSSCSRRCAASANALKSHRTGLDGPARGWEEVRIRHSDLPIRHLGYVSPALMRVCSESVLTQTYSNIEYFVVDGASTDETLDILRSYGERVGWVSELDSGQTEAINKGLRAVRGEIVGYLNSDDVLLPDAIEKVVDYFCDHPVHATSSTATRTTSTRMIALSAPTIRRTTRSSA